METTFHEAATSSGRLRVRVTGDAEEKVCENICVASRRGGFVASIDREQQWSLAPRLQLTGYDDGRPHSGIRLSNVQAREASRSCASSRFARNRPPNVRFNRAQAFSA